MSEALLAALQKTLPPVATIEELAPEDQRLRESIPIVDGRLAPPYQFEICDGEIHTAKFEIYDLDSRLGRYSAKAYRTYLNHSDSAATKRLILGNVACQEFGNSQLLGDPIRLLAREGLPPNIERLQFQRLGPVTHAGDLGFYETSRLTPLLPQLHNLKELEMGSCRGLGRFDLPQLRWLRIHSNVSAKNLIELARAKLPALERLELACDIYSPSEQRFKAMRSLLRSSRLPRLVHLVLEELDLDDDGRLELDEDEIDEDAEPDSWVDMIADSPLLRQLRHLDLAFRDDERELPSLVRRAQAFQHLETLEFWGFLGKERFNFPTRETLREAFGR